MTTDRPGPLAGAADRRLDQPRVPRPGLSRGAIVLALIGGIGVASYAALAYVDYEPGSPAREEIPASVRSSPGGYRTFHFWHSGYHGGK